MCALASVLLWEAADAGDFAAVRRLICQASNLQYRPRFSDYTPLMIAALRGHLHIVQLLIAAKVPIHTSARHTGWTALHCACGQGHSKVAAVLVHCGANVMAASRDGVTALDLMSTGCPPLHAVVLETMAGDQETSAGDQAHSNTTAEGESTVEGTVEVALPPSSPSTSLSSATPSTTTASTAASADEAKTTARRAITTKTITTIITTRTGATSPGATTATKRSRVRVVLRATARLATALRTSLINRWGS